MAINEADWKIEHQCPQCGAPVLLTETDRVLACPFCKTRLYLVTQDHFRYFIPTPQKQGKGILYLPYWRFKGISYAVQADEISSRFIDSSLLATDGASLPSSLGLKPQAMKLKFVSPDTEGQFLEASRPFELIMPTVKASDALAHVYHRAFIGETISMVYAPAYIENGLLHDALLERPLCAWQDDSPPVADDAKPPDWRVRFVPTLCPRCGWDMQGERDAHVLTCKNCDSAWSSSGTTFTEIPFTILSAATREAVVYLPFWRMKPRVEGIALNSYADLIRLANLPRAIQPDFASTPVYFWSPAFKVHPALFLRWSRQMTVFQPSGKICDSFSGLSCYPVILTSREAVETMKITLAQIAIDKRGIYPLLDDLKLSADEITLVYHPFLVGQRELTHEIMRLTIARTALNYGVYL